MNSKKKSDAAQHPDCNAFFHSRVTIELLCQPPCEQFPIYSAARVDLAGKIIYSSENQHPRFQFNSLLLWGAPLLRKRNGSPLFTSAPQIRHKEPGF
jgi:hypothetical protein